MLDLLLRGARLIDGTGAPWIPGDLAIQGRRIVEMGNLRGAKAKEILDLETLSYLGPNGSCPTK